MCVKILERIGMEYIWGLMSIGGIFLLACCSPGPVFMLITATAASVTRRSGVFIGLGVAAATFTWASLTALGLGLLLSSVVWLHTAIKVMGGLYLIWLGLRALIRSRPGGKSNQFASQIELSGWKALRTGYVVSITNPKALAFFGSIFALMLPPSAPAAVYFSAVLLVTILSAIWHCGLAVIFSLRPLTGFYRRSQRYIDVVIGAVLVGLGIRLIEVK